MKENKKIIHIKLPESYHKKLKKISKNEFRTMKGIVEMLVIKYIETNEAFVREELKI